MRFRVAYSVVFAVGLLLPSLSRAQGLKANLENPAPNSFQSGIGVLSGWVCNAQRIDVEFDGQSSLSFQVAYGTTRRDTTSECGDANNGFGMTVNWNLLGDGQHRVRALADGVEFANHTFTVTTLGAEFLTGASGSYQVPFAGKEVTLTWEQPLQNFAITGSTPLPGGVSGNWIISVDYASEDCNFLQIPGNLPTHLSTVVHVSQNGSALTVESGSTTLTGQLQPNGDFTVTAPPEVQTALTCTFSLEAGYSGNFNTGTVAFVIDADRVSGNCGDLSLPCTVTYRGTITRVATQEESGAPDEASVEDIFEAAEDAIAEKMR